MAVWLKVDYLFLLLAFREDDLVDEEENDHGNSAVQDPRHDIVDKVCDKKASHSYPDAVDGVYDTGNNNKRQEIPENLIGNIAFTAENHIPLQRKIDGLADKHGDKVGKEVTHSAVGGIIS